MGLVEDSGGLKAFSHRVPLPCIALVASFVYAMYLAADDKVRGAYWAAQGILWRLVSSLASPWRDLEASLRGPAPTSIGRSCRGSGHRDPQPEESWISGISSVSTDQEPGDHRLGEVVHLAFAARIQAMAILGSGVPQDDHVGHEAP